MSRSDLLSFDHFVFVFETVIISSPLESTMRMIATGVLRYMLIR